MTLKKFFTGQPGSLEEFADMALPSGGLVRADCTYDVDLLKDKNENTASWGVAKIAYESSVLRSNGSYKDIFFCRNQDWEAIHCSRTGIYHDKDQVRDSVLQKVSDQLRSDIGYLESRGLRVDASFRDLTDD